MNLKTYITMVLCFILSFPNFLVKAEENGADYIFFNYKSFTDMGTWTAYETAGRYNGYNKPLKAEKVENAKDACAYFSTDRDSTYTVWVRCMYTGSGDRRFRVGLNNGILPQTVNNAVFAEGVEYKWTWEKAGEVYLKANTTNKLRLIAYASVYSRCDAVLLTDDDTYIPPEDNDEIKALEVYLAKGADAAEYQGEEWKENSYFYNFDALANQGSWQIYQWDEYSADELRNKFSDRILRGHQLLSPLIPDDEIENAVINAEIEKDGTYALWVRTRQYNDGKNRGFNVKIGDKDSRVGKYCYEGYSWEKAGEYELKSGANQIVLDDQNGYYARFDCMVLTMDLTCQPSDIKSEALEAIGYYNRTCESVKAGAFPEYASNVNANTEQTIPQIKNENIQINFYNQNDTKHSFVQNEVFYKGIKLKEKSESFGRILRSSASSLVTDLEVRKSPFVSVKSQKAFNTYEADTVTDTAWGVDSAHAWTNIISISPAKYIQQSITVELDIPESGKYYAITRGYTYDSYNQRGYTAQVDGKLMTSEGKTHYFNVTNSSTNKKFVLSHNTDPIELEKGVVTLTLKSGTSPMRTSFFALVRAEDETELAELEARLTSYDELMKLCGGSELDGAWAKAPKSSTAQPYAITYDYVLAMNGGTYERQSSNMYNMGNTEWLIPQKAVQTAQNCVTVSYENDKVSVLESWSIESGDEEPTVSVTMTAKREGNYSIIIPSQTSYENEAIDYLFLPMMYRGHGFYDSAIMLTEQLMFTPMVSVTLPSDNTADTKRTYGFMVEPSWLEDRWVYKDNYKFAATLGTPSGTSNMKINPTLTVPASGCADCEFEAGGTYNFKYRPIYRADDWYGTFEHALKDLYNFSDYRKNYYNSVTDAVLNATDVMLDEFYSGWDDNSKAYWNMEGRNIATNAAPLEALQKYYLTDSNEILQKRTIPTLINTLTRPAHFRFDDVSGGSDGYVGNSLPTSVGSYSDMYGADIFGAFYSASGKTMPEALTAAYASANKILQTSQSGKDISRLVGLYKTTSEEEYLDKAKQIADNYIEKLKKELASKTPLSDKSQAYASYMPYLAGLMDIYSVTGDSKYLDVAEYAGQVVLSLVWTTGVHDGEKTITAQALKSRDFSSGYDFWWYGDKRFRVGNTGLQESIEDCDPQTRWDELEDDTVPSWVTSRSGIGLEAPNTFYEESVNVIMASWAGDMIRLSKLTGNELFETAARNAIVGRFGGYGGYSINRFTTYPMKANYLTDSPIDFTSVYWHHIPAFLSMLEDFLISQAWSWSDGLIDFPYARQEGYAYFNTNQYGFASGSFFGEDDMWLWLDRDVIEIESSQTEEFAKQSYQADWICTRKDGVMGIALMNEAKEKISVIVRLGEKANSTYTGPVLVYEKAQNGKFAVREVQAENGAFEVTIQGHSLIGAVIKSDSIKAPSYANIEFINNGALTQNEHTDVSGEGMLLQLSPDNAFAHIYISDKPQSGVNSIEVSYRLGENGEEKTVSDNVYPYELTIPVGSDNIYYNVTVYDSLGQTVTKSKEYVLKPYEARSFDVKANGTKVLYSYNSNVCNVLFNAEDFSDWQGEYTVIKAVYDENGALTATELNEALVVGGKNTEVNVSLPSEGDWKIFIWTEDLEPFCDAVDADSF